MGCDTRVTVSPIGTSSGTLLPNNGADYGPDSVNPSTLALTTTSGIQEALNSIASTGGLVYLRRGAYNVSSPIQGTGSNQTVWLKPGSDLVFNMNTAPLMLLETYGLISIASNLPSSSRSTFRTSSGSVTVASSTQTEQARAIAPTFSCWFKRGITRTPPILTRLALTSCWTVSCLQTSRMHRSLLECTTTT